MLLERLRLVAELRWTARASERVDRSAATAVERRGADAPGAAGPVPGVSPDSGTRCRRPRSCSSRSAIWICRYWRLSSCPGADATQCRTSDSSSPGIGSPAVTGQSIRPSTARSGLREPVCKGTPLRKRVRREICRCTVRWITRKTRTAGSPTGGEAVLQQCRGLSGVSAQGVFADSASAVQFVGLRSNIPGRRPGRRWEAPGRGTVR